MYIWTQEGWLYLATVIDLYSRRVVGWSMGSRMTAQLVCDALRMAIWRRRELLLDFNPLINIDLVILKICFCYILCYIEYSFLLLVKRLVMNGNEVPGRLSIQPQWNNTRPYSRTNIDLPLLVLVQPTISFFRRL